MKRNQLFIHLPIVLIILGVVFYTGWETRRIYKQTTATGSVPLRINSFQFVKPLLVCDTRPEKNYIGIKSLENDLIDLIEREKQAGNIETVSVYFQDFNSDGRIDINKDEKFHPASIGKVPIMIGTLYLAENDPSLLSQSYIYPTETLDENAEQEITPKNPVKPGETYTVNDLIEKMIKYSDNNALILLLRIIKPEIFNTLYQNLQISLPSDINKPDNFDFMTTRDVSYFFRLLYNATYLSNELSDKALKLLSETDYNNGLVAGIPAGIPVSHKFGIEKITSENGITNRQLHDCGIVYHSRNPYLLCVMTKSLADTPQIETTIKHISEAVWKFENTR